MHRVKPILFIIGIFAFADVKAQLSTNEKPISFGMESEMIISHKSKIPVVTLPKLDMIKIGKEDEENGGHGMPLRYGYSHKVNYNIENSGTWYRLPNGDKLWQLNVVCPEALSVNFCYDKFWIPKGGKLFVFSKDRKHSIGAFTFKNNKGDRENVRGFATSLVYGSDVILEYYQPKEITTDPIISIEYVVHGYRFVRIDERNLGQSGSCMVNVNCEEGLNWQREKKAVACVYTQGYLYSGSLITTTSLSGEPLFLTANHCLADIDEDALEDYTFFMWNYETPGCANVYVDPATYTTSGATLIANNYYSDFALLRLIEDPREWDNYVPYYLGWDRSGQSGDPGISIHHPKGDVKKISTVNGQPISYFYYSMSTDPGSHWVVSWKSTLNGHGILQTGSSGSPLFNAEHKVIGQFHAGTSDDCSDLYGLYWCGKFSVSWTGHNNNSIYKRLDCWLDSLNTGVQTMEGLLIIPATETMTTDEQLYCNIRITSTGQLTIQSDIELMGNSRVIVENGGELIIDGGTMSNIDLVLMDGSKLQIINGGILETRNGFLAPVGATVNVVHGKIL